MIVLGVQPLWLKDGRRIITTLLHVSDCHVVRVTTRFDILINCRNFMRNLRPFIAGTNTWPPTWERKMGDLASLDQEEPRYKFQLLTEAGAG